MESSSPLLYFASQETAAPACAQVCRVVHSLPNGSGTVWSLIPYPGVYLLAADFCVPQFQLPYLQQYPYLKLNYCLGGRCEVPLANSRYAYLETGVLSIDLNQSLGALLLPTGRYRGLELILDLELLAGQYPSAWRECGLNLLDVRHRLAGRAGSARLRPSALWDMLARKLTAQLEDESLTPEAARFQILQLLYLLEEGDGMEEITSSTLLTRGQRALAQQAERRLTAELSARLSIETVAAELGVSPSALKKYFGQVYGKPISVYLREKRLLHAKRLLAESSQTINAIALAVGYQNQSKFGAAFREAMDTTPSEYRRLCRAEQIGKGADQNETV